MEVFFILVKNKNIVITGTSRGIGKDLVISLLNKNNKIWGCSRKKNLIKHKNYKHTIINLANLNHIDKWVKKIEKYSKGKIDIFIGNAGLFNRSFNYNEDGRSIFSTINVNLTANIYLAKKISSIMKKKNNGLIVFFSSVASVLNDIGSSSYASSKIGLEVFSKILAKEVKQFKISVYCFRILYYPTKLSKKLNKKKIDKITSKFKTNRFKSSQRILKIIENVFKNKSKFPTIIYDKK